MIPVFKPLLGKEEEEASKNVLNVGWLGMGKNVGDFEKNLSKYLGLTDRYVVSLSTGHAALHLGLLLMGVGKGDEVITPSFNNIADFQAIMATGATPVFCDIEDDTLNIDVEKAEKLITKNTKAIIIMDYDCILCNYDRIQELADKHNIRVLHDAAHSLGSSYNGKMVGSFSDMTMFSFDPVKTITCVDGGALVVKTTEEVSRLHEMRLVGMGQPAEVMYTNTRAWTYDVKHLGFRYHMSNMHAAIGTAQLEKMEIIAQTRKEAGMYYNSELAAIPEVSIPKTDFEGIVPFLYYIRVPAEKREDLRSYLYENGIDTGIHWQPGHWFSLFKDCPKGDLSVTERVGNEVLSLPLHSCMKKEYLEKIVRHIKKFF